MKFMVTWKVPLNDRHQVFRHFGSMSEADLKAQVGPDIEMVGRWHDLARGTGVCILETENPEALARLAMTWNHGMNFDVTPVLDDVEAIRAINTQFAAHATT